jgi:hypothetical protein
MGLDLTLIPCAYSTEKKFSEWILATTRLDLFRNYDIFGQIDSRGRGDGPVVCNAKPLPPNVRFDWYEDDGIKERKEDQYGDKLTYVLAGELVKVKTKDTCQWNKAVFAMMKALPADTPVILWWH